MMDEFEARERRDAEARERAASDEQDLRASLQSLLTTADGKRVVFWLLSRAGIYGAPFNTEAAIERYQLGRQSIGLELLSKLDQIDARLYPRLLLERGEQEEMTRAAREAATKPNTTEDGDDQYA